jgi:hypothetical protein
MPHPSSKKAPNENYTPPNNRTLRYSKRKPYEARKAGARKGFPIGDTVKPPNVAKKPHHFAIGHIFFL